MSTDLNIKFTKNTDINEKNVKSFLYREVIDSLQNLIWHS